VKAGGYLRPIEDVLVIQVYCCPKSRPGAPGFARMGREVALIAAARGAALGEGAVEVDVAAVHDEVLAGGVRGLCGRKEKDGDCGDFGVEGHAAA
jgi:hypothetical protein